jgi:hypothetical protein
MMQFPENNFQFQKKGEPVSYLQPLRRRLMVKKVLAV